MDWAAPLNEYEKLVIRMSNPRVVIDNAVCPTATLVKVDSARNHDILLEAVRVLTDLDLSINKAYFSSDGRWFMDVFHVTDSHGRKITDDSLLSFIERSISADDHTIDGPDDPVPALELTGTDRPGLLSEIFAVLTELQCSVSDAKVWTHNGRIASLIFLESPIDDFRRIEGRLRNVLRRSHDARGATTVVSSIHVSGADRRLHQMMFTDRDYEHPGPNLSASRPLVSVQNWVERGYSIVSVQCRDRPKLTFDVVCTLTDMEYVVFHGTIDTDGDDDRAHLEFYIRHSDGSPISSEAERQRVIQCLQAAIERRASEGLRLELCTVDRRGLLADVTRTFRENGLSVLRAEVSTKDETARNVFYVTDAAGYPADAKTIKAVVERVGPDTLKVKEQRKAGQRQSAAQEEEGGIGLFNLGSIVKRNLFNLGLIRSCS